MYKENYYCVKKIRRKELGRRMRVASAKARRLNRRIDTDHYTRRKRLLDDSRGAIILEGNIYSGKSSAAYRISRSTDGMVNQVDIVISGIIIYTGAIRNALRIIKSGTLDQVAIELSEYRNSEQKDNEYDSTISSTETYARTKADT